MRAVVAVLAGLALAASFLLFGALALVLVFRPRGLFAGVAR